jgi:hypothetical protein
MGYYIGAVVLLLIADVVLSAAACSDLLKAGVVSDLKLFSYRWPRDPVLMSGATRANS